MGLRRRVPAVLAAALLVGTVLTNAEQASAADPLLSQGKPVTASSSGGCCPAANAVDGTTSTRWASGAGHDPEWIYVNLGATARISRVVLTWDASCATAYQVQTSADASTWTTISSTTTGDGGVDDLSVTGSGRYVRMNGTHRCRTDSSKGYSLQEFQVYGTTGAADTQAPTVPANPRTSNLTCNSVTFAWNASTDNVGVTAYDVYHDGQLIKSVSGTTLSTSFTVVPTATWGLYVNARDAAGNVSQASATVNITPPQCQDDPTPPAAPAGLAGTPSGTSVTLRWTASSDNVGVTAYDIYRNGTLAGTVTGSPPPTTFVDSGLTANTTYQYYAVARDAAGNISPHSNQISVTTGSSCTNPVCTVTQITTDTDIPWGLVTLPDGTILYNRRDAHDIIHLNPATGAKTNVGTVPNVESTDGEGGLTGLAISPTFDTDHWLYIMHTSPSDNRVVRIQYVNGRLDNSTEKVLVSGIARNKFHDGGRLRWGPDGKLYASTGDGQNGDRAQDLNSLNGKVLRINPDGTAPSDNPFTSSANARYVWSYGHRNPQGLAFDSQGRLWEQEFGNSVMDETNLIQKGGNYGWPACEGTSGSCSNSSYIAPKRTYPVAEGSCSGIAIVGNALYVACQRGTRMNRLVISGSSLTNLTVYFNGTYGRLRTVEPAPDGGLWLTTSNGDKDSTPNNSSTKVLHVQLGG